MAIEYFDIGEHDDARLVQGACRALFEHTRDIMLLLTTDGRIVLANRAAEMAYQRTREELRTLEIRDLRARETRSALTGQMQEAARSGLLFETEHARADGTTFPVEVSSRGIDVDGEPHLLSVVRDISQRRSRDTERESLLDELTSANRQLEGLLRIVSVAVGHVDIDELFSEVLSALREVMSAEAAMLFVRDGDRWLLREQVGYDDDGWRGLTLADGEGFVSSVAAAGTALWSPDVTSALTRHPVHERFGIRAMFGMPLYADGEVWGVLECAWSNERLVSETERVMLQVASDRIVAALAGVRRFEGNTREREMESALAEASTTLAASHDVSRTVPAALQVMMDALDCDVACFGAFDRGEFAILHALGIEPRTVRIPRHPDVIQNWGGEHIFVQVDTDSPSAAWLRDTFGLGQALIVPVAVGRDMKAAVIFGSRDERTRLDELASSYGRRLSAALGLAYANARDYQAEHRIAETLQEALLNLDGRVSGVSFGHLYRSSTLATRVGGDFYDVFAMRDGLVGALVGDVSGKGLEAAVLTTLVKHTIRAFAHECDSPAEILSRSNEALAATSRLRDFASVALAVIDPASGEGRYCGAGHPPGLLVRGEGGVEALWCGSPVLGAFTGMRFDECRFSLTPGDVLVLYTDGVTEARARSGEFFGDERLAVLLDEAAGAGPEELVDLLGSAVLEFTGGRFSDDVAIVTLALA